jgi:hypothetical protein
MKVSAKAFPTSHAPAEETVSRRDSGPSVMLNVMLNLFQHPGSGETPHPVMLNSFQHPATSRLAGG